MDRFPGMPVAAVGTRFLFICPCARIMNYIHAMRNWLFLLCLSGSVYAQTGAYQWFDPVAAVPAVIDGRGWSEGLAAPYDRFPARAEKNVRGELWYLSHQASGLYINFRSNSSTIIVRYAVKGAHSMPQMPATGVSGVDLYAKDPGGSWKWTKGTVKFGDTIQYRFENIRLSQEMENFRLYLPLYNAVQWMQIGVPANDKLVMEPVSREKCIVAYGTSIMHGAYASRPGLAWTNILGRKLDSRMINLGFSGNGQLEPAVIDLINELDAKAFILDCMPNLWDKSKFTAEEIEKRVRMSVSELQQKHPGVPIVLAAHCSGREGINMDSVMTLKYMAVNKISEDVFSKMKKEGIKHIYYLSADAIGFDLESTVDGTHPNDIGMMKYAEAYYSILAPLLQMKR